jgi:hypothetical protein
MYVDESGDSGAYVPGPTPNSKHYILSGLIIHQNDWLISLDGLKSFRRRIRTTLGLNSRVELHASELVRIQNNEAYRRIKKYHRIEILKRFLLEIPAVCNNSRVINICLRKTELSSETDIQILSWSRLIQRFDTFLKKTGKDNGVIISDATEEKDIRQLLRRMRIYNSVPSHFGGYYAAPTDNILEDPFMRNSKHSYFIQAADAIAYSLYRREYPKGSLKKYQIERFFDFLEPILLTEANRSDPRGIVRK